MILSLSKSNGGGKALMLNYSTDFAYRLLSVCYNFIKNSNLNQIIGGWSVGLMARFESLSTWSKKVLQLDYSNISLTLLVDITIGCWIHEWNPWKDLNLETSHFEGYYSIGRALQFNPKTWLICISKMNGPNWYYIAVNNYHQLNNNSADRCQHRCNYRWIINILMYTELLSIAH